MAFATATFLLVCIASVLSTGRCLTLARGSEKDKCPSSKHKTYDEFKCHQLSDQGFQGVVYQATKGHTTYILKKMPTKKKLDKQNAEIEVAALDELSKAKCRVPAPSREHDCGKKIKNKYVHKCFMMTYIRAAHRIMDNDSMYKLDPHWSDNVETAKRGALSLLEAFQCMWRKNWCHGDMNADNMLIDPHGKGWIIDFGDAAKWGDEAGERNYKEKCYVDALWIRNLCTAFVDHHRCKAAMSFDEEDATPDKLIEFAKTVRDMIEAVG